MVSLSPSFFSKPITYAPHAFKGIRIQIGADVESQM